MSRKKKVYIKLLALLFIFIGSIFSLSSCFTIFDYYNHYTNVSINIVDPTNGKIEIYTNSENTSNIESGDMLYIEAIPNNGYKCDSLLINNKECIDNPYIEVNSKSYTIEASFSKFSEVSNDSNYYLNDNTEIDTTYYDVYASMGYSVTPSIGDVNILVVPIEFSDYPSFSDSELNAISIAFNGYNELNYETNYWESVKSFYLKSSYNKLNFNFTIVDKVTSPISGRSFINLESKSDGEGSYEILDGLKDKLKIDGESINDFTIYDSDKDGFIDGVWLIYNASDYYEVYEYQYFWAYTYSYESSSDLASPNFARYANASQIFLYAGSEIGEDAHTLIHETGHLLGLDDYYTYDELEAPISATGGLDMMDLNIGDHNAFSKTSLGWINPLVINGETSITLKPFENSGEALILPVNSNRLHSAFNEFYILEYYIPTDLFYLDSKTHYRGNYPSYYDYRGLRVFHVDARTMNPFGVLYDSDEFNTSKVATTNAELVNARIVASSNTLSQSNNRNFLIEAITPFNIKTYENAYLGDNMGYYYKDEELIKGLFTSGDVFNATNQSNFFNAGKTNSRTNFDYSIRVEYMDAEGIRLTIKR